MNVATLVDDSTAARCLSLIERHAGRMMRTGGGAISGVRPPAIKKPRRRVIGAKVAAEIVARAREVSTMGALCVEFDWSKAAISRVLRLADVPTPYQRTTGKRVGPPRGTKYGRRKGVRK